MDSTIVKITKKHEFTLPEQFQNDDTRHPESFVRYFLEKYTAIGDVVLDPFAGFGTTLYVAEGMQRIPYGVELQEDRFKFIKSKLHNKEHIVNGSSLHIDEFNFPEIDCCITSPPYMNIKEIENPLTNYESKGSYTDYLHDLLKIFHKIKTLMKLNGTLIVEVSNIKHVVVTTLAWDIAKKLSEVVEFQGEIIIEWLGVQSENGVYNTGYDHSYCLIYKNKEKK